MPHRITPLAKKIIDVIRAENVPNEVAYTALSRAAINMCLATGKNVEWFTHTTLKVYEDFLMETVRRTD